MSVSFLVSNSLLCRKSRLLKAVGINSCWHCPRFAPGSDQQAGGELKHWCSPKLNPSLVSHWPLVLGISVFMERGSQLEGLQKLFQQPGGWNAVGLIP